jgi:hypothetical protein
VIVGEPRMQTSVGTSSSANTAEFGRPPYILQFGQMRKIRHKIRKPRLSDDALRQRGRAGNDRFGEGGSVGCMTEVGRVEPTAR